MTDDLRGSLLLSVTVLLSTFLLVGPTITPLESAERVADRLRVSAPDTVALPDRDTTVVTVKLRVASGWHINTNDPIQDYLIPTKLTLSETPPEVLDVGYPPGQLYSFAFSEEELLVYSDTTVLDATVHAGSMTGSRDDSAHKREWKLTYQPCSDHQCLRPKTIRLPVQFQLGENKR